jgi:DNA gyrase subunit A
LKVYIEHRIEIINRRSEFELKRAEQRAHILEGLRVALQYIDEVINIIRKSQRVETAKSSLRKRFKLSGIQAQAILDMPLRRLASLERKKIEEEYKHLRAQIRTLKNLLRSAKKVREVAITELEAVKEAYGDRRRTQIVQIKEGQQEVSLLTTTDLTPEKTIWLIVTPDGSISRSQEDKLPRISGRNAPIWLVQANTRDTLYLVDDQGEAAAIPVHAIPETDDPAKGVLIEKVSPKLQTNKTKNRHVLTVTQQGMVKKTLLSELPGPSASTFTLVKVNEGDRLKWVRLTHGKDEVLLVTSNGMAIRFKEREVRAMGMVAAGVIGIKLQKGVRVVGAEVVPQAGDVFLLASDGTAKRITLKNFPVQGRHGQGVQAWTLQSAWTRPPY